MDDPLPIGMGLRVPLPDANATLIQPSSYPLYHYATNPPPVPEVAKDLEPGPDGLVDFDELTRDQVLFNHLTCQPVLISKRVDEVMYCQAH